MYVLSLHAHIAYYIVKDIAIACSLNATIQQLKLIFPALLCVPCYLGPETLATPLSELDDIHYLFSPIPRSCLYIHVCVVLFGGSKENHL